MKGNSKTAPEEDGRFSSEEELKVAVRDFLSETLSEADEKWLQAPQSTCEKPDFKRKSQLISSIEKGRGLSVVGKFKKGFIGASGRYAKRYCELIFTEDESEPQVAIALLLYASKSRKKLTGEIDLQDHLSSHSVCSDRFSAVCFGFGERN